MSYQLTNALPEESDANLIGRQATKCFYANIPDAWRSTPLDGDDDCGYDFQIQTVSSGRLKDIFRVQLKGKTNPTLDSNETYFSVSLALSTVNYYATAIEPILLVMCDLSVATSPKNCHLYYVWIHDELGELRQRDIPEKQKTIVFHIPVANKLDENTDLSGEIVAFRQLAKIGEQLDVVLIKDKPGLNAQQRADFAEKLVPALSKRSASLFDALTDEIDSSWINAPDGSLQWFLQEAKAALCSGHAVPARAALKTASDKLDKAKPLEQADYWNMVGRLSSFELNEDECLFAFERACQLTADAERHLIPWVEAELRNRFKIEGSNDFTDLLARLRGSSAAVIGMRSRLMAAEGRFEDALAELEPIEGIEKIIAQSIIFTMQGEWTQSLAVCDAGLATLTLRETTKQLFYILRARAKFSLALGPEALEKAYTYIPPSGPPGTEITMLRDAWSDIAKGIELLRNSGWPGNVELLADTWLSTASMLGLQEATLPIMKEAADARPTLPTLQIALESLAAQAGNFKIALIANKRQGDELSVKLRRVILLNQSSKHKECVELLQSLDDVAKLDAPMLGHAICLGIFSAEKMVRPELAAAWRKALESRTDLRSHLAVAMYFQTVSNCLLAKDLALTELFNEYEELRHPILIAKNLFHELNVENLDQARKCVELSQDLQSAQMLDIDDYLRLAQAYTTLGCWEELLALSDRALSQFEDVDRLSAIGALALDKLGRTAEAHTRLKSLISKPDPDHVALNVYINIASLSGFSEDAIRCIEGVFAQETDTQKQISCLRHLFALIHLTDPTSPRLVEITCKIGQKVNRQDEAQEGLFLMSMFSATLPSNVTLSEERKIEFRKRLEDFTKNFPNSKVLKRATFSADVDSFELMRIIKELTGVDEERLKRRAKICNELKRGATVAPFAWRPRHMLDAILDLPTLWEVAKRSRWSDRQLHLIMTFSDWKAAPFAHIRGRTPILDLTSLLVIQDLGLFEVLFKLFPTIAIGKASMLELQKLLSPMSGTPYRNRCTELVEALKCRFKNIEQPGIDEPDEDSLRVNLWSSEEIVELIKNKDYIVYSDDALFRIYATGEEYGRLSICTLDLLSAADETRLLSPKEVARRIAMLCSWRVGITIPIRYQIAILPDKLGQAQTVSEGIDIILNDELCNAMYSGMWDISKPFDNLQSHAGAMLGECIEDERNSINSIASLAGYWLSKAKFHVNAPYPVMRIIAVLILQAAASSDEMSSSVARRLWHVYKTLVEFEFGERMDDQIYDQSLVEIGCICAEIDKTNGSGGNRGLLTKLLGGLTIGTSDYDNLFQAYTRKLIEDASRKLSN